MKNLIKIAEIDAQSAESAKKIAEALERSGFVVAHYEWEGYESYLDILEEKQ